ncbi:MAG: ATP-binding protein [Candidatus Eremiobacterota bacterium]
MQLLLKIEPVIFVETETLKCNDKKLLIVNVPRGNNKPYAVNKTEFWVKNGADKRRATIEELFRLMQSSNILYADELDTRATFENIDIEAFGNYYEKYYKENLPELDIPVYKLLENLRLMSGNKLTLAGLLLFGKEVETVKPQFAIKATCFEGNDVSVNNYIDKEDITGKLIDQYKYSISFVKRNLKRIQTGNNFNIPSKIEIPEEAFSEAIANAIIHRDYFINSSIFVHIFYDRLEVISPGTLPNNITEENIKYGVHIERNPTLISFLEKDEDFDYTGRGSGIPRIIRLCKNERIDCNFINEVSTQRFKVVFKRKV